MWACLSKNCADCAEKLTASEQTWKRFELNAKRLDVNSLQMVPQRTKNVPNSWYRSGHL